MSFAWFTQQTESLPFEVREFGGKPFFVFDDGMIAVEVVRIMRADGSQVRIGTMDSNSAEFTAGPASRGKEPS